MTKKKSLTIDEVKKVAKLASLTISDSEASLYTKQFEQTLSVVDELNQIDTAGLSLTSQVNNLTNIVREDKVDKKRILTQAEALSGAKNVYHGYFVVKQIIAKDE